MSGRTRSGVLRLLTWLVGAGVALGPGAAMSLPLNVSHRGYSAAFPENTLVAVEGGFAAGARAVEVDLLKSSDGEIVIFHDDTLDRTTNGTGRVDETTLADLQLLDAGSWFAPGFSGERIPTLIEALTLQQQLGAGPLLLDQKSGLLFGAEISAAVKATGVSAAEDIWVTVWTQEQLLDIRAHLPDTFMLWTGRNAAEVGIPGIATLQASGVGGFSFIFESYETNPGFLEAVQAAGMKAYAWNLDVVAPETPEKMQAAIDMGLDGYIVNDPALFETLLAPEPDTDLALLVLVALGLALRCTRGSRRATVRYRVRRREDAPRSSPDPRPCRRTPRAGTRLHRTRDHGARRPLRHARSAESGCGGLRAPAPVPRQPVRALAAQEEMELLELDRPGFRPLGDARRHRPGFVLLLHPDRLPGW